MENKNRFEAYWTNYYKKASDIAHNHIMEIQTIVINNEIQKSEEKLELINEVLHSYLKEVQNLINSNPAPIIF